MNRPWQVWALFGLSLLVALPAIGWLTVKAIESERAESLARGQMELEQNVGRALWRMDTRLTPILAVEAARPTFIFQPFLPQEAGVAGKKSVTPKPSPLLTDPADFVLLNFQCATDNQWSSPQCVLPAQKAWAAQLGLPAERLEESDARLADLRKQISFADLLPLLPKETLPEVATIVKAPAGQPSYSVTEQPPQQIAGNTYIYNQGLDQNARPQQPQSQNRGNGLNQVQNPNADNDLASRNSSYQSFALKERFQQQREAAQEVPTTVTVREGVSVPIWVKSQLLLVRRVTMGDRTMVQGCWLDWPQMQTMLLEEVSDVLPSVRLEPVLSTSPVQLGRMLATLPVQLVVPDAEPVVNPYSPLRISLAVAWGTLLLAAVATIGLLQGVVTMSERRGAFVSAVTHELRTPLTTFRMYAEMLAEGMVPDAEQRQQYLQTLRIEADRLSHLVENVLQYARLERGRPGHRREVISVEHLLSRFATRMSERAAQANLQFIVEADDVSRGGRLHTDPAAVEQILFNLVDNACKYAATATDRRLHLAITSAENEVVFAVNDHGPGIDAQMMRRLFRPFSKSVHEAAHSAPGVGLGLALSRRLACDLGGSLKLASSNGDGAHFELRLPRVHAT